MSLFNTNKIGLGQASVAEQLTTTRLKLGIALSDVAVATKISQKYLEALESGQYHKLPEGIYSLNFLREYAQYLGLDYQKLQASFLEEKKVTLSHNQTDLFARQIVATKNLMVMPHLIRNVIWGLLLFLALGYIVWLLNNIYQAPQLIVITPSDDLVSSEPKVLISGKTETETEITINDKIIVVNLAGEFSELVALEQGVNTIIIEAKKGNKAINTVVKEVLFKTSEN
jgi:cytoskeletal protein RodZ